MKPQRRCNHGGCRELVPFNQVYCSRHERKKTYADYDTYENRKKKVANTSSFITQNSGKMQKYYYPDKPYTDKEMAEQTGLSVRQYGTKRRKIEAKLVVDNDEKIPY